MPDARYLGDVDWQAKLLWLMDEFGETQRRVAADCGIADSTLSNWLNHESEPGISQALLLAARYGLTLDQLFDPNVELPAQIARTIKLDADRDRAVEQFAGRRRPYRRHKKSG